MNPSSIKTRLMTFMEGYSDLTIRQKTELATGTMEIIGSFIYEFYILGTWDLLDIERKESPIVRKQYVQIAERLVTAKVKCILADRYRTYL